MCLLWSYHECMWGLWSHLSIPVWGTPSTTSRYICHCWQGGAAALLNVPDTCWHSTLPLCWDSHASELTLGCHPKSMVHLWLADGTGGTGGWAFQGDLFLAMTGSTGVASSPCLPGLALNKLKAGILVWRVFILFLFVFNWGSIIIYSKHSEASSRAILQLQLGLSSLYALVQSKLEVKADQIQHLPALLFLFLFLKKFIYLLFFSPLFAGTDQAQGIIVKLKWNRNHPGSKMLVKSAETKWIPLKGVESMQDNAGNINIILS